MPDITSIGPYSRPTVLGKIDGRRREAKLMRETRADLVRHVGGSPSAVQRQLIERAVMLSLQLQLFDAQALKSGGTMSERNSRQYLAWSASLCRALRQLGVKGAAAHQPTIGDLLSQGQRAA
ncbi:MAG: hypothetical protein QOJ15_3180 [Bradyrhizobium sp.]|nr:hypothetical protein [Bradyrhizobium sp.]